MLTETVRVIARVTSLPGKVEELKTLLLNLAEPTRREKGCLSYQLLQDKTDEFRIAKRLAVQRGFEGVEVPQPKGLVYSRHDFVNEYWRPSADEFRLDFQYYEHDISQHSIATSAVFVGHRFVSAYLL